jgi:hypothetical protein
LTETYYTISVKKNCSKAVLSINKIHYKPYIENVPSLKAIEFVESNKLGFDVFVWIKGHTGRPGGSKCLRLEGLLSRESRGERAWALLVCDSFSSRS